MKTLAVLITIALYPLHSFALTNSTFAESDTWSSVVQIRTDAPDASGESIPGFCNATFIGKNIMVTAAHCVLLAYVSKENALQIDTGYYKYVVRPDGQRVKIGYVLKDRFIKNVNIEFPQSLADKVNRSGYKTKIGPDDDFAVLWWNEETPEIADMKFATPVTLNDHAQIIRSLSTFPLKVVSINLFSEPGLDTKRMGDLNSVKWANNYVHSQSVVRVEEGDSGAPVFTTINGQTKLFAVVKGRATTIFSNWDVYPAVNPYLCDINKRMPTHMKLSVCTK